MLHGHRRGDHRERFVADEHPVPSGQQIPFEPTLAKVLAEDLHDAPDRPDVTNGIIKSIVFGTAVSLIAVLDGYDAKPTAEGVSSATTRTVVVSSLAILGLDFVLTVIMFRGVGS